MTRNKLLRAKNSDKFKKLDSICNNWMSYKLVIHVRVLVTYV